MANSRIKDYLDLFILIETQELEPDILAQTIKATFERREMALPDQLPIGLTSEFSNDRSYQIHRTAIKQLLLK